MTASPPLGGAMEPMAGHAAQPRAKPKEWRAWPFILMGLLIMGLTFGGGGYWAATAELAGAVVTQGEVRVESNPKPVSHPEGGLVAEIRVREGQPVKAGDPLIVFDATASRANLSIYSNELAAAQARRARLIAERDGARVIAFPQDLQDKARGDAKVAELLRDQSSLLEARSAGLRQRLAQLDQRKRQLRQEIEASKARNEGVLHNLVVARDQFMRRKQLFERGYATRNSVQALERDVATLQSETEAIRADMRRFNRQIDEAEAQRLQLDEETRERALAELRETETRIAEFRERRVVAADALGKITVAAPEDGVVQSLQVHAPGAVVGAGQEILTLVPVADDLIVEARVNTIERDRLSPGQAARIRFSAFNQRTTPEIEATVTRISPDRVIDDVTGAPYYVIALDATEQQTARLGQDNILVPGMPAEIYIATEARTALSYLLKPFTDFMQKAGRER